MLGLVVPIEEGGVVLVAGPSDVTGRVAKTKIHKVKGTKVLERCMCVCVCVGSHNLKRYSCEN